MNLLEEIARFVALSIFSLCVLGTVVTANGAAIDREPSPPWLPDDCYVANGCYLSAIAYIARLQKLYPGVEARPITVRFPSGKLHTVAAVRWESKTFLRDMYIGVAPLSDDSQLSFDAALAAWKARQGQHAYPERRPHSRTERKQEVELAAKLIAFNKPQIIAADSPNGRVSVLWWRTAEGKLGLYEPSLGTAVGESAQPPAAVAQQLLAAAQKTGVIKLSPLVKPI
jgi:hypothetical protein